MVAEGVEFDEIRGVYQASKCGIRSSPDQVDICSIGILAEIEARRTSVGPNPSLEHPFQDRSDRRSALRRLRPSKGAAGDLDATTHAD